MTERHRVFRRKTPRRVVRSWPALVLLCAVLAVATSVPAVDPEGCLFCHRYPGLARVQESGALKIFHIDEQRYAGAPHGGLACRSCHPQIQQVPHTGLTEVSCNSDCHKGTVPPSRIESYPPARMHEGQQSAIVRLDDPSSCRVCHRLYPHRTNPRDRAFLNMHTGFMICEVCHLKKERFDRVVYGWMYTENAVFTGKPYGTFYDPGLKNGRSEHFISRIAPYATGGGEKRLLMNTWDAEKAARLAPELSEESPAREKMLDFFHRDVQRREISVACEECHSRNGLLDLKALGFAGSEIDNLTQLNIKGLVTQYETFYFPHLFD